ncbi:MAG: iron ABC transporter permease [Proteobacteria bacterium]|nr:iron ABC transporter permease [Pseudomonadota bacterium]
MSVNSQTADSGDRRQLWAKAPRLAAGAPRIVALALAAITGLLVLGPAASLIVIASGDSGDLWAHLIAHVIPDSLVETALLLAGVAALTTGIGVGAAWLISTFQFPGRAKLVWLLPLPLAIPTYIVAYVYVDILDTAGPVQTALRAAFGWQSPAEYWFPPIRSLGGAIGVIGFVLYPYVYLASRAMFQTQCTAYIEAARVLGARPVRLVRTITLPLARPAIAVGLALALMETLNDIGASEYLGVRTLTLSIFSTWLNRGNLTGAAQIASLMLLAVLALVALERYGRRRRGFAAPAQDSQLVTPIVLSGARGWLATLACVLPVTLGFFLPAGFLAWQVIERSLFAGFDKALLAHTLNTITYAAAATGIVLALGFGVVAALRWLPNAFIAACVNLAGIGYAMPGTVLALGMLTPLVALDDGINAVTRAVAGVGVGLLIAGSGAAVVIAYVVRFLAISVGFAQSGFARITTAFDDSARLLGAGPATVTRTLHIPLARPAIFGAALLIFVDCLKELPATLLLRPLNVETLSTYVYQFATRGSFEEGALAALMIVAVGVVPVVYMVRLADLSAEFASGAARMSA